MPAKPRSKRGRKPTDPKLPRDAVFSTRIPTELRAALQREANKKGQTLSSEIIRRLRNSLDETERRRQAFGAPRNYWLARLVAKLSGLIEYETGLSWRDDPFTFEAVRTAVVILMDELAPSGEPSTPKRVSENVAKYEVRNPGKIRPIAAQLASAEWIARMNAQGLMSWLRFMEQPPLGGGDPDERAYPDEAYDMPRAREALGLEVEKS